MCSKRRTHMWVLFVTLTSKTLKGRGSIIIIKGGGDIIFGMHTSYLIKIKTCARPSAHMNPNSLQGAVHLLEGRLVSLLEEVMSHYWLFCFNQRLKPNHYSASWGRNARYTLKAKLDGCMNIDGVAIIGTTTRAGWLQSKATLCPKSEGSILYTVTFSWHLSSMWSHLAQFLLFLTLLWAE